MTTLIYTLQGKSTFFNAATCAALRSEDGRKMADVAPHPFTTIGATPVQCNGLYRVLPSPHYCFTRIELC